MSIENVKHDEDGNVAGTLFGICLILLFIATPIVSILMLFALVPAKGTAELIVSGLFVFATLFVATAVSGWMAAKEARRRPVPPVMLTPAGAADPHRLRTYWAEVCLAGSIIVLGSATPSLGRLVPVGQVPMRGAREISPTDIALFLVLVFAVFASACFVWKGRIARQKAKRAPQRVTVPDSSDEPTIEAEPTSESVGSTGGKIG